MSAVRTGSAGVAKLGLRVSSIAEVKTTREGDADRENAESAKANLSEAARACGQPSSGVERQGEKKEASAQKRIKNTLIFRTRYSPRLEEGRP
jgi:hypothetical protein